MASLCIAVAACETPGDVSAPSTEPEATGEAVPPHFPLPVPRPPRPVITARPATESQPAVPDLRNKPRPATHVVKSGEDMYLIATMYGIDAYTLATSNGLAPPFTVVPGQQLTLPPSESQIAAAASAAEGSTTSASDLGAGGEATKAPAASSAPAGDGSSETAAVVPPPRPPVAPQAVEEEGFIWPVSGEVISDFGPKGNGLFNDGINIAAARGAPIRAAESGVVAYAGNELRGFGNMLLIKHADGWVTAYAHADELLVSKGERVSKGQVIGRVGSTGNVGSPQLHFEMRKGKRAVDPVRYLRRSAA